MAGILPGHGYYRGGNNFEGSRKNLGRNQLMEEDASDTISAAEVADRYGARLPKDGVRVTRIVPKNPK